MSKRNRYHVLWVDEEDDIYGLIKTGERYELNIQHFNSWDKARVALNSRFDSFSAIILDGRCVVNQGEEPTPDFLYQVVREMETIFAQHDEMLPWYVLSAETSSDFEDTLRRIGMGIRNEMVGEWGRMFYRKKDDIDDLCISIKHIAAQRNDNKIKTMYRDVFNTMDRYFTPDSKRTMLDILQALHFPEDNRNFDPVLYYTQLRKILEYLFRAANRLGMLPDEVMGEKDKVNLSNSSLYLAGRDVYLGPNVNASIGHPKQAVFPPVIAQIVKSILVVANKNSHTVEMDPSERNVIASYYNTLHSNNFLFGYTLHLCDVIIWFGNYASQHAPHTSATTSKQTQKQKRKRINRSK